MQEDQTPLIGDFAEEAAPEGAAPQQEVGKEGQENKKHGFSSKIGFVLAAAGSAVGLGNLWRFPYLAAKYGGGMFLLCYVLLAVTFGFCLLVLEIAIGRKTGKGVIGAFAALNKKFKWFGFFCLIVPIIIVPYYCVIGGWVIKYLWAFLVGDMAAFTSDAAAGAYFGSFTASPWQPIVFFLIFSAATILVVVFGVQKGIERVSKILMPLLAVLAVFLAIYAMCQPGALEGVKKLFVPDFGDFRAETLLAALGQLFYSMSLAMCIMITYGSYMKKSADIQKSARQISICDTLFAIFAAMIIIPSIYSVTGGGAEAEAAMGNSGPSLMFVVLPQVFNGMFGGRVIGVIFFVLVFFAALTSSISLVEAIVAVLRENCHLKRWVSCLIVLGIMLVLGILSSLGFGPLSMIHIGDKTILDIFDYASNSILMPIVAIGTCIIAGYFLDTNTLMDEIGMRKKGFRLYYKIMIRYIAPVCMAAILISGLFLTL
ncbi:MAG TPA: sodium-dependent transporter [Candidatus Borkfalkia excrementavium]|uniref:Transporter n=1 Tax=Candidatus Borkfalkia excrementavium TaxID=2838505 RepID=A0A9D2CFV9_9FIRM|nr:sodium-dependent transporter [Candidatus Borkfalkia excrementavium]